MLSTAPTQAQATQDKLDTAELESKIKAMYREVAENPHGEFHFEMGRTLAERLGYEPTDLDRIPAAAIESFAGVGYYFHLADLQPGQRVLDLGSGSGMDTFIAALKVGGNGRVVGVDMTEEQRSKAEKLQAEAGFDNVRFVKGYIEDLALEDASFDAVISNGVINLSADKHGVFREAARVLKPGGRLALSDIVTDSQLPESIKCDATLWAACIGGAIQRDDYRSGIESAGLRVEEIQDNPQYLFISDNAQGATRRYGVQSVSLLAVKP